MAVVGCPANVSSITLATSGVLIPASRLITCTALEATNLVQTTQKGASGSGIVKANQATGAEDLKMPSVITAITINSIVYTPDGNGFINNVPAADAEIFRNNLAHRMAYFSLITG